MRTPYGNLPYGFYSANPQGQAAYQKSNAPPQVDPLQAALEMLKKQMSLQPPQQQPQPLGPQPQVNPPGSPQFDPSVPFNQPATPGVLPQLNQGGVNPYLSDPLMSSYNRLQNPLYGGGGDMSFYGDPELFNAPTAIGAL